MLEPFLIVVFESLSCPQCEKMDLKIIQSLLDILSERERNTELPLIRSFVFSVITKHHKYYSRTKHT